MEMRCHFRSAQGGGELAEPKSCACVCARVQLSLSLLLHADHPDPATDEALSDPVATGYARCKIPGKQQVIAEVAARKYNCKKRGQFERFRRSR